MFGRVVCRLLSGVRNGELIEGVCVLTKFASNALCMGWDDLIEVVIRVIVLNYSCCSGCECFPSYFFHISFSCYSLLSLFNSIQDSFKSRSRWRSIDHAQSRSINTISI